MKNHSMGYEALLARDRRIPLNPAAKKKVADICELFNKKKSPLRDSKISNIIKALGFDPNAKVKMDKKTKELTIEMLVH